jgi:gamma-glutamyltranspeptidase / glutathione hydrolase
VRSMPVWRTTLVAVSLALLLGACRTPLHLEYAPGQVDSTAGRGVVVAEDPAAAGVGAAVLREGGNAVDAVVATAFMLAVTYPQAGPPGGGGFAVVSFPGGEPVALDFRETAPAAATRDMFLRPDGKVDRDLSLRSALSSGVPGTPAGLEALHKRFGKLPWRRLVEPAVTMAREGYAIPAGLAKALNEHRERFEPDPEARAIFVRDDRPWQAGDVLVQADLAKTLAAIRDRGAAGFYEGATAAAIEDEMKRGGGIITRADLAAYRPTWREPARFPFQGREVVTMPLPSSAGIVLHQILAILEASGGVRKAPLSADRIHLFVEAERRAFADRNAALGDPAGVPEERVFFLTSAGHIRTRALSVDAGRATPSHEVRPAGGPTAPAPTDTTNLCVVDGEGGAVALTYSLNATFGSHIVARGTGVLMNDHMDDFSARPGAPNLFGLRQGAANAIVPGRRPLSSMSPTIVRDGGEVVLVLGAAGGPRILSSVAQVIVRHLVDDLPLDVAVITPRVHHQHRPDVIEHEEAEIVWPLGRKGDELELTSERLRALTERGHFLKIRPGGIGRLTAISRDPRVLRVRGVAGPRSYGISVVE